MKTMASSKKQKDRNARPQSPSPGAKGSLSAKAKGAAAGGTKRQSSAAVRGAVQGLLLSVAGISPPDEQSKSNPVPAAQGATAPVPNTHASRGPNAKKAKRKAKGKAPASQEAPASTSSPHAQTTKRSDLTKSEWKAKGKASSGNEPARAPASQAAPASTSSPHAQTANLSDLRKAKGKATNSKRKAGDSLEPAAGEGGESQDGERTDKKRNKRLKVQEHLYAKGEELKPEDLSARAFQTDPTDHCETPFEAYRDIEPWLFKIASSLGKRKGELQIYDPYYCEGSMKTHLSKLNFSKVYNCNEDFYEVIRKRRVPEHDVLVTNPPFSGEHLRKIVDFCVSNRKPFFLLMPNFVMRKSYYKEAFAPLSKKVHPPFFISPSKAYKFWSPGRAKFCSRFVANTRGGVGAAVPFETVWYIGGFIAKDAKESMHWWRKKYEASAHCTLSPQESDLPEAFVPVKAEGEKRPNPRQRKALANKRRMGTAS